MKESNPQKKMNNALSYRINCEIKIISIDGIKNLLIIRLHEFIGTLLDNRIYNRNDYRNEDIINTLNGHDSIIMHISFGNV